MIDIETCPVCNGINFTTFLTCKDHSVSHETFDLVRCTSCGLLITSPRPADNHLEKYYLSDAYTSHANKGKTLVERAYFFARTFTLKWKLSLLTQNHPKPGGTLLDFGCGVGEFLKTAVQARWQATGVEPSETARQKADPSISQNILPTLKSLNPETTNFDAITAWHVLEHVSDLNITIDTLKALLKNTGTMFIAVPNHDSWDARHYKNFWAAYDVPRHLWHFNINSMTRLLAAHSLTVARIIPMRLDAYYVSLLSEKYKNETATSGGILNAIKNGFRTNHLARKNMEYSSLIYIVKR